MASIMNRIRFISYHKDLMARVEKATAPALQKAALLVEARAKKKLSVGAPRWEGPRGGRHMTPSTPPNPPHLRTGSLKSSVASAPSGQTYIIGPTERYGKVHEQGGEWGGRHYPARPFMWPSLVEVRTEFAPLFKAILK